MPLSTAPLLALSLLAIAAAQLNAAPLAAKPVVPWQFGPRTVTLRGVAALPLHKGHISAQNEALRTFLDASGNPPAGDEVAVVAPANLDWFVVVSYDRFASFGVTSVEPKVGEIVAAMRRGNAEANQLRRRAGRETLDLLGWREKPVYNATTHLLEWAVDAQESGGRANANRYWLYLTRNGVLTVELVTEQSRFARASAEARELLRALQIVEQEQYVDPESVNWLLAALATAAVVMPMLGFTAVWWFTRRKRAPRDTRFVEPD